MKKSIVRMFALMICAVMVLGMIPAKANAAIEYNEDWGIGIHFFTEFADLVEIARAAAAEEDEDRWYYAVCQNENAMTFASDLVIPENLQVEFSDGIVIPAGVDVTVYGSVNCRNAVVQGTVTIGDVPPSNYDYSNVRFGYLSVWGDMNVVGAVNVNCGTLNFELDSTVTGEENIHAKYDESSISVDAPVWNEADLLEAVDIIAAADNDWYYYISFQTENFHLSNPITIPAHATISISYPNFVMTGAEITVNGNANFYSYETDITIKNDLVLGADSNVYFEGEGKKIILEGDVTNNSYIFVYTPVVFKGAVKNNYAIDIVYENGGKVTFEKPEQYDDQGAEHGYIFVNANVSSFPNDAIGGLNVNSFQDIQYYEEYWGNYWYLSNYKQSGNTQPPVHTHTAVAIPAVAPTCTTPGYTEGSCCAECGQVLVEPETVAPVAHTVVTVPAVAPTCLTYGATESAYCSVCNTVLVKEEKLAPLGHDYGMDEAGVLPDFWDTTCDVCGAERVVDPHRPTHSMYRMFNPNSGEHFYSGSMEERLTLEAAGWKYEGIAFTFPASTGKPVYRLYDRDNTKEHLYTMDEEEKAKLIAEGWIYEGIAFNSGETDEVPQYRLHNPNATIGAYHFTADETEKATLLAAGWEDQGIGFYSCLQ